MPKGLADNLRWRQSLRQACAADPAVRAAVASACQQSCLFWINAFVWTFRQKTVDGSGNEVPVTGHRSQLPFVSWPCQEEAVEKILDAIANGRHLNIKKSRDMGVSWLVLLVFLWFFLFRPNSSFMVLSRKEELVDKPGDMDSLFEKLRYVLRRLPTWQRAAVKDRYKMLVNTRNRSTITGESTNEDAGRGGRKTAILVDEAAAVRNADEIEAALSQNTPCVVWVSTSKGPGTHFAKRIRANKGETIFLHWIRHPEKAAGCHLVKDAKGNPCWTSPWYESVKAKVSARTIAREIDCDDGAAGDSFFDPAEVDRHVRAHVRPPLRRGSLVTLHDSGPEARAERVRRKDWRAFRLEDDASGPLMVWCPLVEGRPPQHWRYVGGCDISNGSGDSNTVNSILCLDTNEIVAKWVSAFHSPEEAATEVYAVLLWVGGAGGEPFLAWENNGPGGIFGRKLLKLGLSRYYRQRVVESVRNARTSRFGWHSSEERKEMLLGQYRDALSRDRIINHCAEALQEVGDYIYDEHGLLIPSRLREDPQGGRRLHGDHVIADALCVLARDEVPAANAPEVRPPSGTYAFRRQQARKRGSSELAWAR